NDQEQPVLAVAVVLKALASADFMAGGAVYHVVAVRASVAGLVDAIEVEPGALDEAVALFFQVGGAGQDVGLAQGFGSGLGLRKECLHGCSLLVCDGLL